MRLYHSTTLESAQQILVSGFRDGSDDYGCVGHVLTGVFLADSPVDVNEGAAGDAVLCVDLDVPSDEIDAWEIIEEYKRFREFMIPAATINARGHVFLIDEGDYDSFP